MSASDLHSCELPLRKELEVVLWETLASGLTVDEASSVGLMFNTYFRRGCDQGEQRKRSAPSHIDVVKAECAPLQVRVQSISPAVLNVHSVVHMLEAVPQSAQRQLLVYPGLFRHPEHALGALRGNHAQRENRRPAGEGPLRFLP